MLKYAGFLVLALLTAVAVLSTARADMPGFVFPGGCCYFNDVIVRTVAPSVAFPNTGIDNFYAVSGQAISGLVGVAPGSVGYHGGHWKFFSVTSIGEPSLLTSEAAILVAASAEHVTITRVPANDLLCPIEF